MKGQYLAVETVFVFGLGLMVAIGVITLFNQFKIGVLDDAQPKQADIINSQIETALVTVKNIDDSSRTSKASYRVDLTSTLSGSDYSVNAENETVVIRSDGDAFRNPIQGFKGYDITGSSRGGDITVFKQGTQLEIRSR